MQKKNVRFGVATLALLAAAMSVRAEGVDLTPVTTGVTALGTAILAAVGGVITGALGLMAIKFGGKWVLGVWKRFTS